MIILRMWLHFTLVKRIQVPHVSISEYPALIRAATAYVSGLRSIQFLGCGIAEIIMLLSRRYKAGILGVCHVHLLLVVKVLRMRLFARRLLLRLCARLSDGTQVLDIRFNLMLSSSLLIEPPA